MERKGEGEGMEREMERYWAECVREEQLHLTMEREGGGVEDELETTVQREGEGELAIGTRMAYGEAENTTRTGQGAEGTAMVIDNSRVGSDPGGSADSGDVDRGKPG